MASNDSEKGPLAVGGFARTLRQLFWAGGWILLVGNLHFLSEIIGAILERPDWADGGFATLAGGAQITSHSYWLGVTWLTTLLLLSRKRSREGTKFTLTRRLQCGLLLGVIVLVSGGLLLARSQHITLCY